MQIILSGPKPLYEPRIESRLRFDTSQAQFPEAALVELRAYTLTNFLMVCLPTIVDSKK